MSGGIAPSKSTVYVGNLPFSLTNSDVHKVFSKFGRVVKVTILRDKITRTSKGVAFVQFIDRDSAVNACKSVNEKVLFERKIKCVVAKDNGRASEFIKRKEYPDKSACYECGETGHLSYNCPKNILGNREPPPKKEKKRKKDREDEKIRSKKLIKSYCDDSHSEDEEQQGEDLFESSLSYAIELEARSSASNSRSEVFTAATNDIDDNEEKSTKKKLTIKPSSYFSDEEEEEQDDE